MIPRSHRASVRSSTCDCLCGFLFILTLAFLICATPALLSLLILLQPDVPNFNLHSSSLSILNASNSINNNNNNNNLTADWNIILSILNPNNKPMSYYQMVAIHNNHTTVTTNIPSFVQDGKVQQNIQVAFTNIPLEFTNCSGTCGALNLTLEVQAKAKYEGWTWPVKTDSINVVCRLQVVKLQFPLTNITSLNFDSGSTSSSSTTTTCYVKGRWKTMVTNWNSLFWNYIYFVVIFLGILFVSL